MESLYGWLDRQTAFPEALRPEDIEGARASRREQVRDGTALRVLSEPTGFIVWQDGLEEQDTGEPLLGLWGWEGDLSPLLDLSLASFGGRKLLIELPVEECRYRATLRDKGFELQRHLLSLTPRTHHLATARQGRYRLRAGTELDRPFLCGLATANAVYTIPPGEGERLPIYTASILKRFTEIDLGPHSPYDLLVAEEGHRAVGYVIIELEDERTAHLLDLSVKRSHWGLSVAQFLVRATENLLVRHGVDLLHTEISAANRRSLVTARRSLKFEPRVERWASSQKLSGL